jgi:DNA/RNA endonuclease G (NUC1)
MVGEFLSTAYQSFTWPKFLYSAILISVAVLLFSEVLRLWTDNKTYIGTFRYYVNNAEDTARAKEVTLRILDRHAEFRRKVGEVKPSQFEKERRLDPKSDSISKAESVLEGASITISEVNITDILTKLRRWVSAPRELSGSVSVTENVYRATVSLEGSQTKLADGTVTDSSMYFAALQSVDEVAFDIACSLIWLEAAKTEKTMASLPRDEFCGWARVFSRYADLLARKRRMGKLSNDEIEVVRKQITELSGRIDGGVAYSKFYMLRADLVDLIPSEARTPAEEVRAQNDRLRYETLLALLSDLKEEGLRKIDPLHEEAAYKTLARFRPAIPWEDGKLAGEVTPEWTRILDLPLSRKTIALAAKAAGLFRLASPTSPPFESTAMVGFAVSKNVIATIDYSIMPADIRAVDGVAMVTIPPTYTAEFFFTDGPASDLAGKKGLRIKRILFGSKSRAGSGLVLLEIDGHDTQANPPLPIDFDALKDAHEQDFEVTVGFPEPDPRLPPAFVEALLGGSRGAKRVMPGQIVSLPSSKSAGPDGVTNDQRIRSDSSTMSGVGGGPVVDLNTGKLIGVNVAGQWKDIREGKYAYSLPVSQFFEDDKVRDAVKQAPTEISFDKLAAVFPPVTIKPQPQPVPVAKPSEAPAAALIGYNPGFLPGQNIPLPVLPAGLAKDSDGPFDYVHFSLVMSKQRRFAFFAAANVDGSAMQNFPRQVELWTFDPRVDKNQQADNALYVTNALDRALLIDRRSVMWGDPETAKRAALMVAQFTNTVPMHSALNQRSWAQLTQLIHSHIAAHKSKATIFAGPVFSANDPDYRTYRIPLRYWKIAIFDEGGGPPTVAAYVLSQAFEGLEADDTASLSRVDSFDPRNSRVKVKEIESLTGLDFGPVRQLKERSL